MFCKAMASILDAVFEALVEGPLSGCDKHLPEDDDTCYSTDDPDPCERCKIIGFINKAADALRQWKE